MCGYVPGDCTCGDGSIDVKAISVNFTGFIGLHPSYLLDLKGKIRTSEYIEGVFYGKISV